VEDDVEDDVEDAVEDAVEDETSTATDRRTALAVDGSRARRHQETHRSIDRS
jgi:hypothetical protein